MESSPELSSSDLFRVPSTNMPPSPEPLVGDVVEITYDGSILESYPAQFGTIYSMKVVSREELSEIDAADTVDGQKLTLDDVVTLSQKGDALTWSDFEPYQGREIGSGLYIMRYRINELLEVWVGGVPDEMPMYIYLMVNNKADDRIDIRTEDVSAFIAAHYDDLPKVDELVDALNKLDYQPYTCDGLPEYQLIAADGTVYSINFSENWVWRGNNEQAELPGELIPQLKEACDAMDQDRPIEARPDKAISQTEAQETIVGRSSMQYGKSVHTGSRCIQCPLPGGKMGIDPNHRSTHRS